MARPAYLQSAGLTSILSQLRTFYSHRRIFLIFSEGSWVRVYGSLKALANNKSVTVSALRKIVDYNEVTFHFLEAMSTHLFLTKPSLFVTGALITHFLLCLAANWIRLCQAGKS